MISTLRPPTPSSSLRAKFGYAGSLVLFLALALSAPIAARQPPAPVDEYVSEIWGPRQGLTSPTVTALAQSEDGYIWIGTRGGLFRFDGHRFDRFSRSNLPELQSNSIMSLAATGDGAVWASPQAGGLHRYHPLEGWTHFQREQGLIEPIHGLAVDDRGKLLVMGPVVMELVDGELRPPAASAECPPGPFHQVGPALDGGLWWLGESELIHYRAGRCDRRYSLPSETTGRFESASGFRRHFSSLLETRNGTVLSGTFDTMKALLLDHPSPGLVTSRRLLEGPTTAIALESDHTVLIGRHAFELPGLVRLPVDALTPVEVSESVHVFSGLVDMRVSAALRDSEGGLWVGTYKGLQRFQRSEVRTPALPDLPRTIVMSIFELADNDILVGFLDGIVRYRDGHPELTEIDDPTGGNVPLIPFSFSRDPTGDLWLASQHGLFRWQDERWAFVDLDGLHKPTMHFFVDSRGQRLVGSRQGLFRLDGMRAELLGLENLHITEILEDRQGRLWLATARGLFELADGRIHPVVPAPDETAIYVRRITEDPEAGGLWLGTIGRGLVFVFTDGPRQGDVVPINTTDGLFDDDVWHILKDDRGVVWMCSDLGIFAARYDDLRARLNDPSARIESRHIGTEDGLRSLECNGGGGPAALRASDGHLWFPTTAGPVVVDPSNFGARPLPNPATIQGIRVDDKSYDPGILGRGELEVPYRARSLTIRFTAPSLRDASNLRFRYQLEPYDPTWRPTTIERSAVYGRLPPGHYQFRVQAQGEDGVWAGETKVGMWVPTPAWRSTWALLTYAGLILGALAWFVNSQRRQVAIERAIVNKQMKVLEGLLPICSMCKDIRAEDGDWVQLESYIDSHSEAAFSHGICPRCMKSNFAELIE